ncbi:PREDICTED: uncharacterized protein LOC104600113 [Nelumbo nucifera]|uniref:Uncharacterized protein LOC104600113 n=2 Tax=Nelumbo nucifera TaxID=4432 RepID=A0A1U8AFU0_NELNU|nr:PREDICTED: uncharacterized protein LOC104600113 [Nelumbo nucifera]XP_010261254.1 PREDICTED: uncharacterized protein LOC104600113 [Nelumbo nucifera]XP_010261255.1 PREDICTED: uncharacterized protein LOC104600113 [Nelumbo nucifera]DAD40301.1 TPA_asm: hypothetical protein HUJ06_014624 [Nelumbo nucifera]
MNRDTIDGLIKKRPVLADVTNQHGKRGFLSISGSSGLQNSIGFHRKVEDKMGDSEFAKQVCLGVENLVKGKCKREYADDVRGKGLLLLKANDSSKDNIASGNSRIRSEIKDTSSLFNGDLRSVSGDATMHRIMEKDNEPRDGCISSASLPTGSGQFGNVGGLASLFQGESQDGKELVSVGVKETAVGRTPINEALDPRDHQSSEEQMADAHESLEVSGFFGSSASMEFEPEKRTGFNGNGGSNASVDVDSLKSCACSFCLKAAYILSDLHYQDIKGRLAALKRTRKEVKLLVDKSWYQFEADKNEGNHDKSNKLEFDLMGQWRSLFLHTENILVRESSQLQSSLLTLKDLRGSCKTDLEMINGMPSQK